MPVRAFLDEVSTGISGCSPGDFSSMWAGTIQSTEVWIDQKQKGGLILFLPVSRSWDMGLLLPLDWDLHHQGSCFAGLWTSINYCLSGVPCLLRADGGTSQLLMSQFFIINICVYLLSVLFLWRTQTDTCVKLLSEIIYWCLTLKVRSMFNVIIITWRTSDIWIPKLILWQVILTLLKCEKFYYIHLKGIH